MKHQVKTISTKSKWNKLLMDIKRDYQLYLLISLPIIYFIIFKYLPMYGVVIAFKDYNIFKGIMESEWIGFRHFKQVLSLSSFHRALGNTLTLNLLDLLFMFPAPILLAICLNEISAKRFKKISQTILYLPHFISWVVIGGIMYQLFATTGIVNNAVKGLGFKPLPFLTNKWYWLILYVAAGVWQSAGWDAIIYIAAMTGIDPALFEAAEIDGANRLQKIYHVTLPAIKGTIVTLFILKVGQLMGIGFERPFIMGNTLVKDFSDVISTYVYRIGLQGGEFSSSTAVGLFQSVVGLVLIIIANFVAKKCGEDGIW